MKWRWSGQLAGAKFKSSSILVIGGLRSLLYGVWIDTPHSSMASGCQKDGIEGSWIRDVFT
jgi:hypothetical protein